MMLMEPTPLLITRSALQPCVSGPFRPPVNSISGSGKLVSVRILRETLRGQTRRGGLPVFAEKYEEIALFGR
jgi:hypothetical protein